MPRPVASLLLFALSAPLLAQTAKPFTVADALSAPFMNQLTAAPAKDRVAWFVDDEGKRNVWVASPAEKAHSITHNTDDDGQDIDNITWSPDAESVAYTHGTGPDGSEHPTAANPAHLQTEVKQRVEIATLGGVVRVIGEGHAPCFSVGGKRLFFLRKGAVWSVDLGSPNALPEKLITARGIASALRPSPDGLRLAFVSKREDHSFIGVFTFASRTLIYADPGTGLDHDPVWSPDSRHIAFIRESPVISELELRRMREGVPWSIRIADATTGQGSEAWRADAGAGSLFYGVSAKNQLLWMNDGRIVFPWEKTGWVHLYSLMPSERNLLGSHTITTARRNGETTVSTYALGGGPIAAQLLTPGDFEVDHVVTDGKLVVYSSNQVHSEANAIDQRHIWSVTADGQAPVPATQGYGSETEPALLSDGNLAAMAGSARYWFFPVTIGSRNASAHPFATLDPLGLTCNINGKQMPALELCERGVKSNAAFYALATGYAKRDVTVTFPSPQQVIFPATDGLPIHGQLLLPRNARGKLPVIVFFHGGSRRQMLLGYSPMQYYAQAYEMNQYFVSRGYAVLSVNYRSGTGYGMKFRQVPDYGVFGGSEYLDVEGAVKYLKSRPDIDTKRMGVWGGSYGGYLTALALARDSADFAAGVDLHGVHDWSLELERWKPTDDPDYDPVAAARLAYAASPMADLKKWRSPVLLMQGDDDRNVLFSQTVRMAAALRAQGVHVEEKVFPDEVHDFLLHRNWVTAFELAADFFDRTLKVK